MSRARILADYVSSGDELAAVATTANAALPKAGGAMTGAITTNSTFDGIDIATRDAVLTSTTTLATAAAPKASPAFTGTPTGITASHILTGTFPAVVAQTGTVLVGNVSAGQVGEVINCTGWHDSMAADTLHAIADGSPAPLVLTAGDWDVSFSAAIYSGSYDAQTRFECFFSLTSASASPWSGSGQNTYGLTHLVATPNPFNATCVVSSPVFRINLSTGDSFYLNLRKKGAGTTHGWAQAIARRVR